MARVREGERLEKSNMKKVIALLEGEKPITKKAACEVLNISYNTTRLNKLIEQFKEDEENKKQRRARLRGKPITDDELKVIAQEYLNGVAISTISEFTYRTSALVKTAVKNLNIPLREADASYFKPYYIEDSAICEDYLPDDLVYSARYQCPALVDGPVPHKEGKAYRIYLLGTEQCYAFQPYWELADLRRVQKQLQVTIRPHEGAQPSYNPPHLAKKGNK